MMNDARAGAARYYDLNPKVPDDVPFYLDRLPPGARTVLELGCGTGRVSIPLARRAVFLHGVDHSPAMIDIGRRKLLASGLPPERAVLAVGDITSLRLGSRFDFIIAPFRVMQNLATDAQVSGLFETVREHLAIDGRCILNAFRPKGDRESMIAEWGSGVESLDWEGPFEGGRVTESSRRTRVEAEPLVIYPDLIFREYAGETLRNETILPIAMRCWYPDELLGVIGSEGFDVTGSWGGYTGEHYGEGPELVVEFARSAA
jgi:SAM-dependent methyltransferase